MISESDAGQNTLPLIARVFSDRTLKIVGRVYARGSKRHHSGYINVIYSGLTHSSIMVALAMGELCAPPTAVGGAARHKHGRAPFAILRRRMSNDKSAQGGLQSILQNRTVSLSSCVR